MTKLEKIGLDHILQLVINAQGNLCRENVSQSQLEEGSESLESAIDLLTSAINDDS